MKLEGRLTNVIRIVSFKDLSHLFRGNLVDAVHHCGPRVGVHDNHVILEVSLRREPVPRGS
jgi:hypothetical protein